MAEDEIALKIVVESERAQMSLGELELGFKGLQEKLKDTNRGTEEGRKQFKELASQMAQTSAEIKNIELSFEGLDREQVASELGSVAGGIGDVTASLVLMGGENETIEQMGASIEKAMAISMGFKGAIEGMSSGMKLYNNLAKQGKLQTIAFSVAQKAQAIGTKALAIVQGILNAVMSLNPLGLIIIAVVAITAAFVYFGDTMKKILKVAFLPFFLAVEAGIYIWNKFKDTILNILKVAFAPLLLTIKFVTDALKALGIMESDTAKATRLAGDEKIKSYKKQADELEKLQAAHKKLTDQVIGDMTHEIALLKAKGEYSEGLEWELIGVKIKAAKKAKKISEDALALEKENKTRAFGWATEEEKKRLKELEDNVAKESDILNSAEEENELFIANRIGRRRAREKQEAIDAAKLWEDGAEARALSRAKESQAKKDAMMEDVVVGEHDRTMKTDALDRDTIHIEGLLSNQEILRDVKAKYAAEELERIAEENAARRESAQISLDLAMSTLAEISSVAGAYADADVKAEELRFNELRSTKQLTEKQLAAEELKTSQIKDAIRKKQFENEKKMQLATAAMNGAQALISILAQYPKFDGGFAMIAALAGSVITTAASIAKIKATTFTSTPSAALPTLPSGDVSPDGAGGAGAGAQINAVTNTSTILGNQQVYVTETDITTTQNNVSVIEESATF